MNILAKTKTFASSVSKYMPKNIGIDLMFSEVDFVLKIQAMTS